MKKPVSNMARARGRWLKRKRIQGFGLIEAMVSIVVLSLGLLGVAALQATALRNNESASQRSMAIVQAYSILDAMRSNAARARNGDYNFDIVACAVPNGATQRDVDIAAWVNSLKAEMGDSACGGIQLANGVFTIRVRWNDERAGGAQQEFIDVEARL